MTRDPADPNAYQLDYQRGVAAKCADEPYDYTESPGWIIGYGDAILIEPDEEIGEL